MSRSDVRRTLVSSISALTAGIALSACGSDDAVVDTPAPVASNVSTTVPVVSNPSTTPSTTSSSSTTPPLTNDIVLVEFPTAESVIDCHDKDICTDDACVPENGACKHVPVTGKPGCK